MEKNIPRIYKIYKIYPEYTEYTEPGGVEQIVQHINRGLM